VESRLSGDGRSRLKQRRAYTRLRPGPGQEVDEVASNQRRRLHEAMLDLVAAEGYEAITVRKLSKLAGVSTASFYARFDGKEDCFLATCSLVLDRIQGRVRAARAHHEDRHTQLTRTVEAFLAEPTADPDAARVGLVDAFGGGPAALGRMRAFETSLEVEIGNNLSRRGNSPSPAAVSWITAGCFRACRTLLTNDGADRKDLAGRLAAWGVTCLDRACEQPPRLGINGSDQGLEPHEPVGRRSFEERDTILAAITKLATGRGYWGIRVSDIRKQAGVSRPSFDAHFSSAEDCYLAAAAELARSYLSDVLIGPRAAAGTTVARLHRASAALMTRLAGEPTKARFAFIGILDPGAQGLKCRERLIGELAADWQRISDSSAAGSQLGAEISIGAFWNAIAQSLEANAGSTLVSEASTFASLLLASNLTHLSPGRRDFESALRAGEPTPLASQS
jgi:AcrR family transcriptional regulator